MELKRLDLDFVVCKIKDTKEVDYSKDYIFLSKTEDEISLVCENKYIPSNTIVSEGGWKALKITGILDFGMVGVIARIAGILAEAKISIFVVSTYNTDYLFLKSFDFDRSVIMLKDNGYTII